MRSPDRGARQAVQRRHVVDHGFRRRGPLGLEQLGGIGPVQERQHRDFLAGDHGQRQEDRARCGKAAGRRRTGEIFAQPAHSHHGGGERHQRKGSGAGRDHLRRLVAVTARKKQVTGNRHAAQHDGDVGQHRGGGKPDIGHGAQRDQSIERAMKVLFIFGQDIANGNDGIGQLRAGRQRQHRQECRQSIGPAISGGETAVEHAGARQPGEEQQQQCQ